MAGIIIRYSMWSPWTVTWFLIFDQHVVQPQIIPYSGIQYFPHYLLTLKFFRRNIFCHKTCVLVFCTIFLWNIFIRRKERELIKNIRMSSGQRAVFLVRFTRNLNFPDRFSKIFEITIFMKFRPCVQMDKQTCQS